jgi:hypothetical protein
MKTTLIFSIIIFILSFGTLLLIPEMLSDTLISRLTFVTLISAIITIGLLAHILNEKIDSKLKEKNLDDIYFNNICEILHGKTKEQCSPEEIDMALDHFYELEGLKQAEKNKHIKHLN